MISNCVEVVLGILYKQNKSATSLVDVAKMFIYVSVRFLSPLRPVLTPDHISVDRGPCNVPDTLVNDLHFTNDSSSRKVGTSRSFRWLDVVENERKPAEMMDFVLATK